MLILPVSLRGRPSDSEASGVPVLYQFIDDDNPAQLNAQVGG
jgi:hypothetical protein